MSVWKGRFWGTLQGLGGTVMYEIYRKNRDIRVKVLIIIFQFLEKLILFFIIIF